MNLSAQTRVPQSTKLEQQRQDTKPPSEAIAAEPPASLASTWSSNQPPNQARVSWDSRGLEIEAANSSLEQILRQVAAVTGARVEGLTTDQRIFGSYGPGPGCDVLSKLLDGSGYNVFMVGCRDIVAPLEIVLSERAPASQHSAANNQSRSYSGHDGTDDRLKPEPQPDPTSPPPNQDPFNVGGPPADPQQHMKEILQRQQKIDQEQLQQNNPQQ